MEKNFEILKERFPEVFHEIEKEKNLKYTVTYNQNLLKINNLSCYSKYNPEKEAENMYKAFDYSNENILIFGISNPFLIRKFIEKNNRVSIFIPDKAVFYEILKLIDISDILLKIENIFIEKKPEEDFIVVPLKVEKRLFSDKLNNLLSYDKKFTKVLLVNPIYGGSLPVARYVSLNLKKFNIKLKVINSEVFYDCYKFLKENFVNRSNYSRSMNAFMNFISETIIATVDEFKPDILLGVAQSPIDFKVLNYCKDKGIIKAFWFVEDYKLFSYWKEFAPFYDFYFTIQKDNFFVNLKKIGVKNFYYLPLAAEPTIHKPLKLTEEEKRRYGSTISFVGAGYYNRRIFFRNLLEYDFKIWGSDWDNEVVLKDLIQDNGRRIPPEEYVKIFNASLINLNLHSSTYLPGVDPDGDFVNPRTFEINATKSIQIVDRRKYLPELFKENEEILCYSNENELKVLIKEIVKDRNKYLKIAEKGYKRVLSEHTYRHRVLEMFNFMGIKLKEIHLVEGTFDFYFYKFNNIDEIAEYIKKKEKINKDEAIFMLMKALKDTYLR